MEIPHRPTGQRPETAPPPDPNANAFAQQGYGFVGGFGPFGGFAPVATARFGNFTLSTALGGLFPSFFNIQVHGFPDANMYGPGPGFHYGYSNAFHGGPAHGFPQRGNQQQQADSTLKFLLLIIETEFAWVSSAEGTEHLRTAVQCFAVYLVRFFGDVFSAGNFYGIS
ncbi:uncharacterized protein LOC110012293 [Sesamum indicum]|uniref:Uncharacterized protein LOC110012293 n=1 Tax=Sesamum indicum TaxID=4182 RepID=A0A8M8V4B9_SESIN|nr:uncharacterized protein LOC110012293 [Sesamum indicum]